MSCRCSRPCPRHLQSCRLYCFLVSRGTALPTQVLTIELSHVVSIRNQGSQTCANLTVYLGLQRACDCYQKADPALTARLMLQQLCVRFWEAQQLRTISETLLSDDGEDDEELDPDELEIRFLLLDFFPPSLDRRRPREFRSDALGLCMCMSTDPGSSNCS